MRARVLIRPKAGILDPQGVAVEQALPALGFAGVQNVHVGRLVELDVEDAVAARRDVPRGCSPTRSSRTTRSSSSATTATPLREVRRPPVPRLLRRGRRAARGGTRRRRGAALAPRPRPAGLRRDRRPRRLLLRRLPARRRDRALLAGDGVGDRVRRATAASCSGSATASRCSARRGLLPGALLPNANRRFTFRQVDLDVVNADTAFTRACEPGERLSIPAKHSWGRYYAPDDQLDALEASGQVVLRYDAGAELQRLAARHRGRDATSAGNVFGLMPHPEHAVDALTGSTDGLRIFESMALSVAGRACLRRRRCRPSTRRVALGLTARRVRADRREARAARPTRSSSRCSRCCGASTAPTSTPRSCCARCRPRASTCSLGPGENAGVVDVGDGLACAFKVESHNHPSAVEPFQGAATGVGGILRDIFAIGARPVAVLDSLRFGEPATSERSRYLLDGAVARDRPLRQLDRRADDRRRGLLRGALRAELPRQRDGARARRARQARAQRGGRRRQPDRPLRRVDRPRRDRRRVGAGHRRARRGRRGQAPDRAGRRPVRGEQAASSARWSCSSGG